MKRHRARMDFASVMTYVRTEFSAAHIRYALIGGHAVDIYAGPNLSRDLDLIVHGDDVAKAEEVMHNIGYAVDVRYAKFSQCSGAIASQGIVDIAHGSPVYGTQMIRNAQWLPFRGMTGRVPVVRPEDLIGLKVIAMANNPKRRTKDWRHVLAIVRRFQNRLDWDRVAEFFEIVKRPNDLATLRKEVQKR